MATLTTEYQYLGRSSGMASKSGYTTYYLLLYGKSIPNKTTGIHKVYIKYYMASIKNSTFYGYATDWNGKINNTQVFGSTTTKQPDNAWEISSLTAGGVTYNKATLIKEGSLDIDCTNGLSKDIPLSAYWKIRVSTDDYTPAAGTSRTVSVTATLPAIPRKAELVTASNINDEQDSTITYNNVAGESVDKIEACIADSEGQTIFVPYREVSKTEGSYTFNFTETERNTLRQAATSNTLTIRYVLKTTVGGVVIEPFSHSNKTLTLINHTPTVNPTIVDSNEKTIALTGDSSKIIRYHSNALATINASARKYATITGQRITNNGVNVSGATATFNTVSNSEFTFYAKDSRNNPVTKVINVASDSKWIEYVHLTCNAQPSNPTAEGDMVLNISGNYFNNSFGATSNTLTLKYRMTAEGTDFGDWVTVTPTLNGNTYNANISITGLDYQTTYKFEAQAVDKLETTPVKTFSVRTKTIFDWSDEDFQFNVPVNVDGTTTIQNGNLNVVTGNISASGDISTSGDIKGWINGTVKSLPSGTGDRAYWNSLPNGEYWYSKDSTAITEFMPHDYGIIHKTSIGNPGDFSIMFYAQPDGKVWRKSGNSATVTGWNSLVYTKDLYPIGTCYVTETNTNPKTLGAPGTWELYDKQFKDVYEFKTGTAIATLTSLSSLEVRITRTGHMVHLDCNAKTNANLTDTTVTVCTLKPTVLGFTGGLADRMMYFTGYSDGGNNMIQFGMVAKSMLLESYDVVGDDSHKVSSGANIMWSQTIVADNFAQLADAYCDKFYWKRIA